MIKIKNFIIGVIFLSFQFTAHALDNNLEYYKIKFKNSNEQIEEKSIPIQTQEFTVTTIQLEKNKILHLKRIDNERLIGQFDSFSIHHVEFPNGSIINAKMQDYTQKFALNNTNKKFVMLNQIDNINNSQDFVFSIEKTE